MPRRLGATDWALLTVEDLAELLRTTPGAIRQLRYRGASLPQAIRIGRRILFRPEDVDTWLEVQAERDETAPPEAAPTELSAHMREVV